MEKYTGAKTIGDGTYGSVLKAINKQNGKSNKRPDNSHTCRRNRCDKEDEEEVLSLGPMHQLEGNPVTLKTVSSKYCEAL